MMIKTQDVDKEPGYMISYAELMKNPDKESINGFIQAWCLKLKKGTYVLFSPKAIRYLTKQSPQIVTRSTSKMLIDSYKTFDRTKDTSKVLNDSGCFVYWLENYWGNNDK